VADALRKALPHDREYALYVVDNLFGYNGVSPEWTWIDMGNYYAAGTYGISVFDNSYKLFFNTIDRKRCPQILRTEPEMKNLTFQNALTLNTTGRDNGYIYGIPPLQRKSAQRGYPRGKKGVWCQGRYSRSGFNVG